MENVDIIMITRSYILDKAMMGTCLKQKKPYCFSQRSFQLCAFPKTIRYWVIGIQGSGVAKER